MVKLLVDRDGQVHADGQPISFPDLQLLLAHRHTLNANLPVYISGARDAKHGAMIYVLDFVKRAGIERVAFSVNAP